MKIDLEKLADWHEDYVHTLSLYGAEIKRLLSPCVYGWQRGNEWLYIGFSNNGFSRVMTTNHHVLGRFEILDGDQFYLWQPEGKSVAELKAMEQTLINLLEPKFNVKCSNKKNIPGHRGFYERKTEQLKNRRVKKVAEEALKLVENE